MNVYTYRVAYVEMYSAFEAIQIFSAFLLAYADKCLKNKLTPLLRALTLREVKIQSSLS